MTTTPTTDAARVGGQAARIAAALRRVYDAADWWPEVPAPPDASAATAAGRRPGHRIAVRPVPLGLLLAQHNAIVEEVPGLTRALAGARLLRWGVEQRQLLGDPAPLVGFIYANANAAGFLLVVSTAPGPGPIEARRGLPAPAAAAAVSTAQWSWPH